MAKEDKKLHDELLSSYEGREVPNVDEILGFKLGQSRCFIPFLSCGRLPSRITTLIPLYETVIMPIHPIAQLHKKFEKVADSSTFKTVHGLTPTELATLAEEGRVLPYFCQEYTSYDERTIKPLLQSGLPRVSPRTMLLIRSAAWHLIAEGKDSEHFEQLATEDIKSFAQGSASKLEPKCATCLALCYMLGIREQHREKLFEKNQACLVSYAASANYLDAVLQANCTFAKEVMGNMGDLPEGIDIDYFLKGLRLAYSPDLSLEEYVEVFDSKTSKALRRILTNLLSDPLSSKYNERLSAKIYDLNRQVREIADSKIAKVYETVSDMALYGGKKFIESQSQKYVRVPKRGFIRMSDWLASKGIDLTAKVKRKDWSIAQLYRAQCKLKSCR